MVCHGILWIHCLFYSRFTGLSVWKSKKITTDQKSWQRKTYTARGFNSIGEKSLKFRPTLAIERYIPRYSWSSGWQSEEMLLVGVWTTAKEKSPYGSDLRVFYKSHGTVELRLVHCKTGKTNFKAQFVFKTTWKVRTTAYCATQILDNFLCNAKNFLVYLSIIMHTSLIHCWVNCLFFLFSCVPEL